MSDIDVSLSELLIGYFVPNRIRAHTETTSHFTSLILYYGELRVVSYLNLFPFSLVLMREKGPGNNRVSKLVKFYYTTIQISVTNLKYCDIAPNHHSVNMYYQSRQALRHGQYACKLMWIYMDCQFE